jgi:hypothetical protein
MVRKINAAFAEKNLYMVDSPVSGGEPEPGDTTSITLDHGVAGWPTPFDICCCVPLDAAAAGTLGALPLLAPVVDQGRRSAARYACPFRAEV